MRLASGLLTILVCLHPASFLLHSLQGAEPVLDSVMYRDPAVPAARAVKTFPDALPLWLKALDRPEKDLKARAALTIVDAHRRGMSGFEPAIPALVRELERPDVDRSVRTAVAAALVELDARDAAPALWKAASAGEPDVRDTVEPALARWDFKPVRTEWLARLDQLPLRRPAVLAMQGLAAVKEERAAPRLREIVFSQQVAAMVRLEAARALGVIRTSGSEGDARRLSADLSTAGRNDRLLAASLLRHHQGDDAVSLLQALGRDGEPAVAAVALTRLIEIDPKLVLPFLEQALARPDANVRGLGVTVLHRLPSDPHVRLLADRLSDPHPDVRKQAREAMRDLDGKPPWRDIVRREATRVLAGTDWRGLEQSAIFMGQVDHKPAAGQLVGLLEGNRGEAIVAAAWALRALAVPDTLPGVLQYVQGQYGRTRGADPTGGRTTLTTESLDQQFSHLAQFFGQGRYRPADQMLRQFVPPDRPENRVGGETRAASAWALGLIHEGTGDVGLATMFGRRLSAVRPPEIEDNRVRLMCAISLGRLKAESALPVLREFYSSKMPSLDPVNNACGWSIEQITGEKMPPAGTVEMMQGGWFLYPIR